VRLILLGLYLGLAHPTFAETLAPAKLEEQSPREELRRQLFGERLSGRACLTVSKNPAGTVSADPALTAALQKLIDGINKSAAPDLVPLFHPQLKVKTRQVAVALTSISRISGNSAQASLFRAYALNNPDGVPELTDCAEDSLSLRPLYGHKLQVAAWIQVQGEDEVSRVYADFVPSKSKWLIGAWHVQQWTHAGKDFTGWREMAINQVAAKQPITAWILYDLAIKLLDGGKFLSFPVTNELLAEQAKLLGGKTLLESIAPKLTNEKLVYAASLFSRKGAAVLLRFGIDSEWSGNAIREHCRAKFKQLQLDGFVSGLAGIRCDYVLPKESPLREGALGGIFMDEDSSKVK
jgi:hypothetical protein